MPKESSFLRLIVVGIISTVLFFLTVSPSYASPISDVSDAVASTLNSFSQGFNAVGNFFLNLLPSSSGSVAPLIVASYPAPISTSSQPQTVSPAPADTGNPAVPEIQKTAVTNINQYFTTSDQGVTQASLTGQLLGLRNDLENKIANISVSQYVPGTDFVSYPAPAPATPNTGTSSFSNGLDIASGCFSIGGVCIGGGGGSGIVAIGPSGQTQSGSTVTFATSSIVFNGLTSLTTITGSINTLTFTDALSGVLGIGGGGTGTSTAPSANKLLVSDANGNWEYVATTSLGIVAGSGTVNTGVFGQLSFYGANGTAVSGTTTIVVGTTTKDANNVGIGTTSPSSLLSIGSTNGINFSTATSSFSSTGGISLTSGCFAIGGTCIGGAGGSQTPWISDISGGGYNLSDVGTIAAAGTGTFGTASIFGNGSNAIIISSGDPAGGIQIGNGATASAYSVAIGGSSTSGNSSVAIGYLSQGTLSSAAFGAYSYADYNGVALGVSSRTGQYSTAIGATAQATGYYSTAIGYGSQNGTSYRLQLSGQNPADAYPENWLIIDPDSSGVEGGKGGLSNFYGRQIIDPTGSYVDDTTSILQVNGQISTSHTDNPNSSTFSTSYAPVISNTISGTDSISDPIHDTDNHDGTGTIYDSDFNDLATITYATGSVTDDSGGSYYIETITYNYSYSGTAATFVGNVLVKSGDVGIQNSSPAYTLDVGTVSNSSGPIANFTNADGNCDINPTTASLECSSDERLKKNIETLSDTDILHKLSELRTVTYNWNKEKDADPTHTGYIAQEVQQIFPGLVSTDADGYDVLSSTGLIPYITAGISELNDKVTALEQLASSSLLASPSNSAGSGLVGVQNGLEMKDQNTGEIYCVSIINGDWSKIAGTCGSQTSSSTLQVETSPSTSPIISVTASPTSTEDTSSTTPTIDSQSTSTTSNVTISASSTDQTTGSQVPDSTSGTEASSSPST